MTYQIVPIAKEHISGFHAAIDVVARERRYLAHLEAPPFEETRRFILDNIELGYPQFAVVLCQEGARAPCCTRDEGGPFGAVL